MEVSSLKVIKTVCSTTNSVPGNLLSTSFGGYLDCSLCNYRDLLIDSLALSYSNYFSIYLLITILLLIVIQ